MSIEKDIPNAKRILLDIMKQERVNLVDAEKKAIELYGQAITFDQAKQALLQEEAARDQPKPA